MLSNSRLGAISPLDGRYAGLTAGISRWLSEEALIRHRVLVECAYLQKLCATPKVKVRKLKRKEKLYLEKLKHPSPKEIRRIAGLENTGSRAVKPTKHDVKAVEYFLKRKLSGTSLKNIKEFVHFGLTSEDINNISYALMLRGALHEEVIPALRRILAELEKLAVRYAACPLLARTHGQPAVPTTFGKEFRVFHARLARQLSRLESARISAKLNGAAGNYNAHVVACPGVDWEKFSREFIESFNDGSGPLLTPNPLTTQIEPHDSYVEICDILHHSNVILLGFCQDMWRYISAGLITQMALSGEIGSSTMPQKVNPIHFENAEGNLGLANALLGFFSSKLPVSRLQRDLSDSTVLRNFGVAFGHGLAACRSILSGLERVTVDRAAARAELDRHPEAISEGIQTILRRENVPMPYEQLAALARGRSVSLEEIHAFIDGLKVAPRVKAELRGLSPVTYLGLSEKLALARKKRRLK